jgi:hypothetical protein
MRGRSVCMAFGAVLLCLPLIACSGGDDEAAGLPATGSEVCDALRGTERFRYTFSYVIDSPQQENPPADPPPGDLAGSYAVKPSAPDFRFETTHSGAAVRPDRLDLEISTTPDQPSVRTIRIGQSQWYLLGERWQIATEPTAFPFTPPNVCDVLVAPLDLSGKTADLQSVGDTEARHVRIDGAPLSASHQLFGPASDMGRLLTSYDIDLWLSKNNDRLVKVEAVSKAVYPSGRELSARIVMDVGSYNDDEIEIQPPL